MSFILPTAFNPSIAGKAAVLKKAPALSLLKKKLPIEVQNVERNKMRVKPPTLDVRNNTRNYLDSGKLLLSKLPTLGRSKLFPLNTLTGKTELSNWVTRDLILVLSISRY